MCLKWSPVKNIKDFHSATLLGCLSFAMLTDVQSFPLGAGFNIDVVKVGGGSHALKADFVKSRLSLEAAVVRNTSHASAMWELKAAAR